MTIYTKLDKFPGYNTLDRELRNAYHKELEYNHRLNDDREIIINFYGLHLSFDDCESMKVLKPKISRYLGQLKTQYELYQKENNHPREKRYHHSKPGRKIKDAISIAYDEALSDIEMAIKSNWEWRSWSFILKFNNNDYEFFPLNMNGYSKLTSDVKK